MHTLSGTVEKQIIVIFGWRGKLFCLIVNSNKELVFIFLYNSNPTWLGLPRCKLTSRTARDLSSPFLRSYVGGLVTLISSLMCMYYFSFVFFTLQSLLVPRLQPCGHVLVCGRWCNRCSVSFPVLCSKLTRVLSFIGTLASMYVQCGDWHLTVDLMHIEI